MHITGVKFFGPPTTARTLSDTEAELTSLLKCGPNAMSHAVQCITYHSVHGKLVTLKLSEVVDGEQHVKSIKLHGHCFYPSSTSKGNVTEEWLVSFLEWLLPERRTHTRQLAKVILNQAALLCESPNEKSGKMIVCNWLPGSDNQQGQVSFEFFQPYVNQPPYLEVSYHLDGVPNCGIFV